MDNKIKLLSVTQRGNKYYFPPTIPKRRSNLTDKISITLCIFLLSVDYTTNSLDIRTFIVYYSCGFLVHFLCHVLYRTILLWEEFKHVKSRYNNNYRTIFENAFFFSTKAWLACGATFLFICFKGINDIFQISVDRNFLCCFIPTHFLLGKVSKLNTSHLNTSLQMSQINGLDYGSGLAYSFFHGYLKLVLPKVGNEDKNIKEIMEIYEDHHGIRFEAYKLFVLIPISLRCFDSLKNEYSPSVDESCELLEKRITVAGVSNRVYKNAVYKIQGKSRIVYVSAEYATPLKTFNDVVSSVGDHTVYYKKHKTEVSLQFYLTLKNILKENKFDNFCELIFYEDSYEENNRTYYYDVGKIILNRLSEIKKTEKSKTN